MKNNRCITNFLKFINLLQINSTNCDEICEGCVKPFLGPICNPLCYNTRPITIYKKNGELFETTYSINNQTNTSSVFRIQNVQYDCVTLLILKVNNDDTYTSTKKFITINTNCICAIKCLNDTIVELC